MEMEIEYIDANGELTTETIVIDDFEFKPANSFEPELDNNDELPPW